jgi:hypothetical protein
MRKGQFLRYLLNRPPITAGTIHNVKEKTYPYAHAGFAFGCSRLAVSRRSVRVVRKHGDTAPWLQHAGFTLVKKRKKRQPVFYELASGGEGSGRTARIRYNAVELDPVGGRLGYERAKGA